MDADGYPDEAELQRIRDWPAEDRAGLLAFVRSLWLPISRFSSLVEAMQSQGGRERKEGVTGSV